MQLDVKVLPRKCIAEPHRFRVFYLPAMAADCRRGELRTLQWSDFIFAQNGMLLTVSRSRSSVPGKGINLAAKLPRFRISGWEI